MRLRLPAHLIRRYKLIKKRCVLGVRMVLHKYSKQIITSASIVFLCFIVVVGTFIFQQNSRYQALKDHGVTTTGHEVRSRFMHEITYTYEVGGTYYKHSVSDTVTGKASYPGNTIPLSYLPENPAFSAPAKNIDEARKDSTWIYFEIIILAALMYVNVFWLTVLGKHI
jgi:hypothetical protein